MKSKTEKEMERARLAQYMGVYPYRVVIHLYRTPTNRLNLIRKKVRAAGGVLIVPRGEKAGISLAYAFAPSLEGLGRIFYKNEIVMVFSGDKVIWQLPEVIQEEMVEVGSLPTKTVRIKKVADRIRALKGLRVELGMDLMEAKSLVDNLGIIGFEYREEEALSLQEKMAGYGIEVEFEG